MDFVSKISLTRGHAASPSSSENWKGVGETRKFIMLTGFACFLHRGLGSICPACLLRLLTLDILFSPHTAWTYLSLGVIYYNHLFMCLSFLWTVSKLVKEVVSSSSFVNLLEIIVMVPGTSWVPN